MKPIALEVDNVSKAYPSRSSGWRRDPVRALCDVSIQVHRGETLAIIGESGAGKSTLARQLLRLDRPDRGRIRIENEGRLEDIHALPAGLFYARVQMVFQDPYSSLNARKRVWQIVSSSLANQGRYRRREKIEVAAEQLRAVGLNEGKLTAYSTSLSGGERQRVSIARALAAGAELLVLDEPLSALDPSVRAQIVNLLLELQQERGLTYVFVSHDLRVVRHLADDVVVMKAGRVVEAGPVESTLSAPLQEYTRSLVRSTLGGGASTRRGHAGCRPAPVGGVSCCDYS